MKRSLILLFILCLSRIVSAQTPSITYPNPAPVYTVSVAIPVLSPSTSGATINSFAISPNLPAGLQFNSATGAITGTPTVAETETVFTVTGSVTGAASVTTTLKITVNNPPPPVIAYPTPETYNLGQAIPALQLTSTGTASNFSINPVLPAGLQINTITGAITGTPTAVSAATKYTITAFNGPTPGTVDINIQVIDNDEPKITYPTVQPFMASASISPLLPVVTGGTVTAYSISPQLPAGLILNTTTGIISGVPTVVTGVKTYVVTGKTANGDHYANVSLSVIDASVSDAYTSPVNNFLIDTIITSIKPANPRANVVYSLVKSGENNDDLPDGLHLNSQTGEITGTPVKAYDPQTYTVMAKNINSDNATYYKVNIGVSPREDAISTPATITFVGQGDIQQSLNTGQKIAANTGIGVVFRQASNKHFSILHDIEVDFSINVASTVDTIKSINNGQNKVTNMTDFGNSVLLPLNSGQAFSFNFKGYFTRRSGKNGNFRRNDFSKPLGGVLSGFNISLNGSNRNWEYVDSVKTVAPTMVKTSLLSLYVGPFYEFYMPSAKTGFNRNVSITIGAGYSGRWILGDVQQGSETDFRNRLLGSDKNSFNGGEVMLGLRFYNIKAEVHLPFFSNKNPVPGLTGTHMTTFIGFSGGFPIDLSKPSSGS